MELRARPAPGGISPNVGFERGLFFGRSDPMADLDLLDVGHVSLFQLDGATHSTGMGGWSLNGASVFLVLCVAPSRTWAW